MILRCQHRAFVRLARALLEPLQENPVEHVGVDRLAGLDSLADDANGFLQRVELLSAVEPCQCLLATAFQRRDDSELELRVPVLPVPVDR